MIVEFAGSPKAGKSTIIGHIRDYFSREEYNVQMIAEGARSCPFSTAHRVDFANWTATQALKSVLESVHSTSGIDMTFMDRGLFDALGFLKLLDLQRLAPEDVCTHFLNYYSQEHWTKHIDVVILLLISPEIAIERDVVTRLTSKPSKITNPSVMNLLKQSYDFIIEQYGARFKRIEVIDVSNKDQYEVSKRIIEIIQKDLSNDYAKGK